MSIALWIIQGVLAAVFLCGGLMKVVQQRKRLATSGMDWVEDVPEPAVKAVGALEVLGAIGVILPAVTGIAPVLVPLAAIGLGLVMVGATALHIRRSEPQMVVVTGALLAMAAIVAWARFGPYAL